MLNSYLFVLTLQRYGEFLKKQSNAHYDKQKNLYIHVKFHVTSRKCKINGVRL